ncbi:nose resistant to fluoxetine protein 6-like [Anticarsia gemmatalis]|uniref:nose resistant to fluoxetine protein 6-like n=1 Tax=Anticarsia gemmatalis TaxID=129554 RepID=UPI003F7579C7
MKYIYLIFFGLIALDKIKCHVTDRSKYIELSDSTEIPSENATRSVLSKESEKKEHTNSVKEGDGSVYLDDVLFALKNQNWSAEEKPCLDRINRLLYNLQNFTLWAVWDWDALSSEPQGLLFGNRFQLGNFDQCMKAPWAKTHPELKTKYCLAEIVLERTDKAVRRRVEKPFNPYQSALDFIQYRPPHSRPLNELTWGACVPAACAPRTVERLLGVMLARSHLGAARMRTNITITEECQVSEEYQPYDGLFYAFFALMGSLTVMCLICTFINCRETDSSPNTKKSGIVQAFCLRENALDLLRMKKEGIEVFYGIRYLTMCLIVLDHQIGIFNSGPISDGFTTDQDFRSPVGLLVLHDDLFVDTFFLLSGFLTITNLAKFKRLPNPLFLILKRYVRLVVAFAIVVFYTSAVFPYTGNGPLWNRAVAHDTEQCRKNWWLNLLMVNNYVDTENICMVISWYIPCDFHFFVVTVLAYTLYKRHSTLGIIVAAILTVAAIVTPGIITFMYQLNAIQLFTIEFVMNPRGPEDYHLAYIKSHTRYAAYLVGFYSGYVFVKYSANGSLNKIKQKWSILGTCSALVLMLAVMLFGSSFIWRSYTPLEGAMYAALNRPVWAAGVALIVFCCCFGHVPLVKSFLSWYPWVPLSRLAYGLYLTHALLITRSVFTTRNPTHNNYFEILNSTAGAIVWGCLASLLLWLLAEAPANKLLTLCLTPKARKLTREEPKIVTVTATTSANSIATSSTGYLHENLPSTIQYSSKI